MEKTNKKAIAILNTGHLTTDVYSSFVNPILPFLAANLGISLAVSTFILSLSHVSSSLTQPIFGYIADSWKKRFFIFFGMLMVSIFIPLMGLSNSVYTLAICLILGSLGNGFYHPQATSFVNYFSSDKDIAKNISIFLALGTFGCGLGPLISSFIIQNYNSNALVFTSIFGLIIAGLILKYVPKISDKITSNTSFNFFVALKEIFHSKPMLALITFSALKSLATQSSNILLPFLWKELGYSAFHIGMLLCCFLVAGSLGTLTSPKLEKLIGTKKIMVIAFCAILPLILIFALTYKTMPVVATITYICIGYFAMFSTPINMVLAQQTMPKYKSLISGFIGGFSWGVVGCSMAFCGLLAQAIGIINVLVIVGIILASSSVLVKYIPEKI